MSNFKKRLLERVIRVGVWGCGYIGLTSALNFLNKGVSVIAYDTNEEYVESIRKGEIPIPNLEAWIDFPVKSLLLGGKFTITSNLKDMYNEDIKVHIIAIPTEKEGEPWTGALKESINNIVKRRPHDPEIIIIESTLTPGAFEDIVVKTIHDAGFEVGKEFLVGIAPRRDWFESPEKNLQNLMRVFAGSNVETTKFMKDILGIVCKNLIEASGIKEAELTKSVENSILHLCSVYAMQLARAYPNLDISQVLRLASTHWRIPFYYPTIGTGGYCVPVSSKYVIEGATNKEELTLLEDTLEFDHNQPIFVADLLIKKGVKKVGMLGVTYKGDLKVHILSPALKIINYLKEKGVEVKAHDPYYDEKEIEKLFSVKKFNYPDDLSKFDALIITPAHKMYNNSKMLLKNLKENQIIIDNVGVWSKLKNEFRENKIIYRKIGEKNWTSLEQ